MATMKNNKRIHDPTAFDLKAPALRDRFGVYGYFYDIKVGKTYLPCRSVLEIIDHDSTPMALDSILTRTPEAYVIMMNPGSSRPMDKTYRPVKVDNSKDIWRARTLTPTMPDITQYQIMKLAIFFGYQHVRILNISDLRQPKSPVFFEQVRQLAGTGFGDGHSLFSRGRRAECKALMCDTGVPVVLGWGRDVTLLPLAQQCLAGISGWRKYGVAVNQENTLFAHPSPMQQKHKSRWLINISESIKKRRFLA